MPMLYAPQRTIYLNGVLQTEGRSCFFQEPESRLAGRLGFRDPIYPGNELTIFEFESGVLVRRLDYLVPTSKDPQAPYRNHLVGDERFLDLSTLTPKITNYQKVVDFSLG